MAHKIYWFSGTGNTLWAAKEFAKSFPDAELISIAGLDRSEDVVFDAEVTGLFFPVYCFGIPNLLDQFLQRVQPMKDQKDQFIYAVCTSGGYPGAALPLVEDTLQSKNINLNACFHIRMISSYYPLEQPPEEKKTSQIFEQARRAIRIAVIAVKRRRRTRPLRIFPIDTLIKFIAKRAVSTLQNSDTAFKVDTDLCDGCGICYRICPAANISPDEKDHPNWHQHCEQCMACLQWCPKNAIRYKDLPAVRQRYHHPDIKAEELFRLPDDSEE